MKKKQLLRDLRITSFITTSESNSIKAGFGALSYRCLTNDCGLPISYSCLGPCDTFQCPPPASTSPGCDA